MASGWCFGREPELRKIEGLLDDPAPIPRALIFEGEPGIGKSTVWGAGIAEALKRGYTVLSTRGTQSETGLSFAGLTDLLEDVVDDVLPSLPEPQLVALEVALLRRLPTDAPLGRRAVGAATLAVLRGLSSDHRVLLAIDDLPWVDRATLGSFAFAIRRLRTSPLRVLATIRTAGSLTGQAVGASVSAFGGATESASDNASADVSDDVSDDASPGEPEDVKTALTLAEMVPIVETERITIEALDDTTIERLLAERLHISLPRRTIRMLLERTDGNPFWALEVGASLRQRGHGPENAGLELPKSLTRLVSRRLAALSDDALEALIVVSAMSHPSFALASHALRGAVGEPDAAIDDAVRAGVVSVSAGRLRPSHPLLGSLALEELARDRFSALHTRLAGVVVDPEQHSRHVALAAPDGPSADVAQALDSGASAARVKGAIDAAIELAELAIRFTPPDADPDEVARRRINAAELWFSVGDMAKAIQHTNEVDTSVISSSEYRRMLPMHVEAMFWIVGRDAAQDTARRALDRSCHDLHLHAVALAVAADVGDGRLPQADLARLSLEAFDEVDEEPDPAGLMTALVMLTSLGLSAGHGLDLDLLRRAESIEEKVHWTPMTNRPSVMRGSWLKVIEDLDGAREALQTTLCRARRDGEDGALPVLLGHLGLTECWAGRYPAAIEATEEGLRLARSGELTTHILHASRGFLYALQGEFDQATCLMHDRLASAGRPMDDHQAVHVLSVLGMVALLRGDNVQAASVLGNALTAARNIGWLDPGRRLRFEGDLGQAWVNVGRLEEASDLAAELRELGERTSRPTIAGVAHRITGLVAAAQGNLDDAVMSLQYAVTEHEATPLPLELGRSLLALGQIQRRRRAKPHARKALDRALTIFDQIGALPFAELARSDLDRLKPGRPGTILTKTERRVGELVASGRTNREVSTELFISIRTVEGHLASLYRKLSVRSRTELARALHPSSDTN